MIEAAARQGQSQFDPLIEPAIGEQIEVHTGKGHAEKRRTQAHAPQYVHLECPVRLRWGATGKDLHHGFSFSSGVDRGMGGDCYPGPQNKVSLT